jgi:hypothetical protein
MPRARCRLRCWLPVQSARHVTPAPCLAAGGSLRPGSDACSRFARTENVKDFRPILLQALHADNPAPGILYASGRAFPRSRKNPGPLIQAVHAWLDTGPPASPLTEDWLLNPEHP